MTKNIHPQKGCPRRNQLNQLKIAKKSHRHHSFKIKTTGESYLLLVTGVLSVGQLGSCDLYKVTGVQLFPLFREPFASEAELDARLGDLRALLASGCFYFSHQSSSASPGSKPTDFTLTAQRLADKGGGETDERFYWFFS
jgi:hypothetical protein